MRTAQEAEARASGNGRRVVRHPPTSPFGVACVQRSFRARLRRRAINPARPVASSIIDAGSGTAVVVGSFSSIRMAPASKQEVMSARRHPKGSAIACPAKIVFSEPCHGLSGRQFDAYCPCRIGAGTQVGVIRVADPHMESTRLIEERYVPVRRFLMLPSAGIGIEVVQCVVQWQRNRHESEQVSENVQRHHTGRSKPA